MGQLLNEMVSPHFYGLSIISNKVVGAWCGQPGRLLLSTFNGSALGACLAWRGSVDQGDYDGSGQQSCKCNYVDFSK